MQSSLAALQLKATVNLTQQWGHTPKAKTLNSFVTAVYSETSARSDTFIKQCLPIPQVWKVARWATWSIILKVNERFRRINKELSTALLRLSTKMIKSVSATKLGPKLNWNVSRKSVSQKNPWSCEVTIHISVLLKNRTFETNPKLFKELWSTQSF